MQINGVGSGQVRDSYQKTNQMPNTSPNKKETDEANKRLEALGVRVELSSQQNAPTREQEVAKSKEASQQKEEGFSLFEILKTLWEEGKKLIRAIWYGDGEASAEGDAGATTIGASEGGSGEDAGAEIKIQEISSEVHKPDGVVLVKDAAAGQVEPNPAEISLNMEEIAQAAAAITPLLEQRSEGNAEVVEAAGNQESFWDKLRIKMKELLGQFLGNMWGESTGFEASTAFDSPQEQPKEEQEKANELGVELPELEGRPLHTSHLQDSYNKYGQYSKLAQDPQSSMSIRK